MERKIFSISKAAKYLNVHPLTLRNWVAKGAMRSFRTPGGHRRFELQELNKFIPVTNVSDALGDVIGCLEKISFKDERQELLVKAIRCLKDIYEQTKNERRD